MCVWGSDVLCADGPAVSAGAEGAEDGDSTDEAKGAAVGAALGAVKWNDAMERGAGGAARVGLLVLRGPSKKTKLQVLLSLMIRVINKEFYTQIY